MFPNLNGTPTDLGNVLNRAILPALNRCAVCGKSKDDCGKPNNKDKGATADHKFERDKIRPEWHGWHAARRLRTLIDRGEDSFVIEQAQKQQVIEDDWRQRTMKDLSDYYLSNHAEIHKRPRSVVEDKAMPGSIILPRLGQMRVSSITHRDVSEFHATLKGTPYRANRVLALLHKMFSFATVGDDNEWSVTRNLAAGIPRFHEEKRERWLSEEELDRLAATMLLSSAEPRP